VYAALRIHRAVTRFVDPGDIATPSTVPAGNSQTSRRRIVTFDVGYCRSVAAGGCITLIYIKAAHPCA
jgi:hypothetical protein